MLSEVVPGQLWVGGERDIDPRTLITFDGVVNVGSVVRSDWVGSHEVAYLRLPQMDRVPISTERIEVFLRFMDERTGPVLIHCQMGRSRAPAFAMLWLVHSGHCPTLEDAEERVREARPGISPNPLVLDSIHDYLTKV